MWAGDKVLGGGAEVVEAGGMQTEKKMKERGVGEGEDSTNFLAGQLRERLE